MIVGSVEVTSVLLLQTKMGFGMRSIGLLVGSMFLLAWPFRRLYENYQYRLSRASWIRVSAFCAFVGCLCIGYAREASFLLFLDFLIFNTVYLAEALLQLVMLDHVLPEVSVFADVNYGALWMIMFQDIGGRFLGPWMARTLV